MKTHRLKNDLHLWSNSGGGNIFRYGEEVEIVENDGNAKLTTHYLGEKDFDFYIKTDHNNYPIPKEVNIKKLFYKLQTEKQDLLTQLIIECESIKDYKNGKPEPREDYDCECGYDYDDCECEHNNAIDQVITLLKNKRDNI